MSGLNAFLFYQSPEFIRPETGDWRLPADFSKSLQTPIFEPYPNIVSKKQVRISEPQEIKNRMPEFLNKNVNLVLKGKTVIYGTLREVSNGTVILSNMRGRKMTFQMDDISEIYTDLDS